MRTEESWDINLHYIFGGCRIVAEGSIEIIGTRYIIWEKQQQQQQQQQQDKENNKNSGFRFLEIIKVSVQYIWEWSGNDCSFLT